MSNQVTSHDSWTKQKETPAFKSCWNCKVGQYLVYESDVTKTPRCGSCGELERDDPAKTKPAPKRRTGKTQEKA